MTGEIRFEQFHDQNYGGLVELANTSYKGQDISAERYLFWEYEKNPDGKAVMHVAKDNDKFVSQYCVLPRVFRLKGNPLKGSLSVNTLTHPGYRGKNLFPKLAEMTFTECAKRDILFTIGFPNPVSLPVIRKKNIFRIDGALGVIFKPLNPIVSFARYFSGKNEKTGSGIPLTIDRSGNIAIGLHDLSTSNAHLNDLLKSFYITTKLTTSRNADFFRWRYVDIPGRTYHALAHTTSTMNAMLIFRAKYIFGIRCLVVVDIIAASQMAVTELLNELKIVARRNKMDMLLSAVTPHSEEYFTLKSAGYFSLPGFFLPQKLTFIVRKHREDCPDEVMNFENWYLTFGDYDIF